MTSAKTRPKVLSKAKERWTLEFVKRLEKTFGERLLAVINYEWIVEDFEDESDEDRSIELVVIIRDYSEADESDRIFDLSIEIEFENEFQVMFFPRLYDAREFSEHATELPWEPAWIVREGRVIYDSGFVAELRNRKPAIGG